MKNQLSNIALSINPSTTLEIDALFKQMKSDGVDVVGFGAGEPDFETPKNIKDAAINAILTNKTKYTVVSGIKELKDAVCKRLKADLNIDYNPENIVVSNGAKHIIFTALKCLLNQGEEVIIPTPYWISYSEMVKQCDAKSVFLNTTEKDNFKITPEKLNQVITDKTKILFLNSPSNPTGMVYTKNELQEIADICVKNNIFVIADEIYYKLVYDKKEYTSFGTFGDDIKKLTILIHGVSKTYCMTGFRIGYALCDSKIAKVFSNYLSHSTSSACTISQYAALEALNGDQCQINSMIDEFEKRRNHIVERINNVPDVSCIKPEGAFYIMMNIEKIIGKTLFRQKINNDNDFSKLFLEKGLVATVPCSGFGCENFVRWSYSASMEEINKGVDRLEEFLNNRSN